MGSYFITAYFFNKIELTKLPFQISAGMKNIIGKELITNPNIAIFEIVKNSYDATASKVTIIFENIADPKKKAQSKLIVIDNGYGMSFDDIKNKWLFAGYSEKKIDEDEKDEIIQKKFDEKIERKERIFTGSKGIGRFSSDRLGDNLIIYTKKENKSTIHRLNVDWNNFKDQKKRFQNVKADYTTIKKIPITHPDLEDFQQGTVLEISPLADEWDRKRLVNLRQFLQRLVNPNQIAGVSNFKIFMEAKEFSNEDASRKYFEKQMREKHSEEFLKDNKEYEKLVQKLRNIVNGEIKNIVFEKLEIKTTHIICFVKKDKITTEIYDKGVFVFRIQEKNNFLPLNNINIHIFYLNKDAKSTFSRLMGVRPYHFGSIFLYKNGFRIQPLGDPMNDWLDLEAAKGQGYGRNLSRREVIGRVEVNGPQLGFQEVSSRDKGVVYSKEYELLLELIKTKPLKWLTRFVVEGIHWDKPEDKKEQTDEEISRDSVELISKLVGTVKDPDKSIKFNPALIDIFKTKEIDQFPKLVKSIRTIVDVIESTSEKKIVENKLDEIQRYANTMSAGMKSYEDEMKIKDEEILFLKKSFSPDTRIIEDYHHHIGISTGNIATDLKEIIKTIGLGGNIKQILPFLDSINYENEKIKSLVGLISKANFKLQKQNITQDIISFISQYVETILSKSLKRLRYQFIDRQLSFKRTFIPLEISMIFDNIIHNSSKANASLVKIKFEIQNKSLHIYIGDNGNGISKEIENHIFDRGFTRTEGSGIGLHNVKTTIEKMNGKIIFKGNNFETFGKGACFEMIIQ